MNIASHWFLFFRYYKSISSQQGLSCPSRLSKFEPHFFRRWCRIIFKKSQTKAYKLHPVSWDTKLRCIIKRLKNIVFAKCLKHDTHSPKAFKISSIKKNTSYTCIWMSFCSKRILSVNIPSSMEFDNLLCLMTRTISFWKTNFIIKRCLVPFFAPNFISQTFFVVFSFSQTDLFMYFFTITAIGTFCSAEKFCCGVVAVQCGIYQPVTIEELFLQKPD